MWLGRGGEVIGEIAGGGEVKRRGSKRGQGC